MSIRSSILPTVALSAALIATCFSSAVAGRSPAQYIDISAQSVFSAPTLSLDTSNVTPHHDPYLDIESLRTEASLDLSLPEGDESSLAPATADLRPKARPDRLLANYKRRLPRTMIGQDAATCLQIAIYHEARSEPEQGQRAVASVVLQRSKKPEYFGRGICGVITKPKAFSYVRPDLSIPPITEFEAWLKAGRIARNMIDQGPLDILHGADHYHTRASFPKWRLKMVRIKTIGAHIFYSDPSLDYRS